MFVNPDALGEDRLHHESSEVLEPAEVSQELNQSAPPDIVEKGCDNGKEGDINDGTGGRLVVIACDPIDGTVNKVH